jgi:hypothetical protein
MKRKPVTLVIPSCVLMTMIGQSSAASQARAVS